MILAASPRPSATRVPRTVTINGPLPKVLGHVDLHTGGKAKRSQPVVDRPPALEIQNDGSLPRLSISDSVMRLWFSGMITLLMENDIMNMVK